MLCKVNDTPLDRGTITAVTGGSKLAPMNTSNNYPNGGVDYMEIIAPLDANYTIDINYKIVNDGGTGANIKAHICTYINGTQIEDFATNTWGTTNYSYTAKNVKQGDIIKVRIWSGRNNGNYSNELTANSGSISYPLILYKDGVNVLPREIKEIWKTTAGTLYGIHTDNIYYGGIILNTDTEATTGSITLGNAIGYIKVNYNGEIIKIPYYGN